jgi:hypothetical protein
MLARSSAKQISMLQQFISLARAFPRGLWVAYLVAIALVILAALFRDNNRQRYRDLFTALLLFVYFRTGAAICVVYLKLPTVDPTLLRIDRAMRLDPIIAAQTHHQIMGILNFTYNMLPLMIAFAWIAEQNVTLRRAILIGGLGAWITYYLCPATGPGFYDWSLRAAFAHSLRNCMPSMHWTWALLLAVNARSRATKTIFWIYQGLVAVSTIALGQHYFIDLIAAIPYALFVQLAAVKLPAAVSFCQSSGDTLVSVARAVSPGSSAALGSKSEDSETHCPVMFPLGPKS